MNSFKVSRRDFLKITGLTAASSSFILGFDLFAQAKDPKSFSPDIFVEITRENIVKIIAHRSEMGTGIRSSLPAVVADELEADWSKVEIIQGYGDKNLGSQNTDGSRSIRRFFDRMRTAGALTGYMLEMAASKRLGVPQSECIRKNTQVIHQKSGRSIPFGDLIMIAAKLPVPDVKKLKFKDPSKWNLIGKQFKNYDMENIIKGEATFGHDIKIDGMLYAAIARPPVVRGKVKSYNQKEVEAMSGVSGSIVLPPPKGSVSFQALGGVAVLANNTWNAFSAKKALKVEWDNGPNGDFDSDEYQKYLSAEVMKKGEVKRKRGDYYATTKSGESYKQSYEAPFLTHLQMEPVVATAEFKDGMCVVWSPTQNPQAVQDAVAGALGIEPKEVIAQVTLLGGGFGRKGKPDYCVEAALLSKQTGKPVQVVWTREDDVKHSYYHAMGAMHLEASFELDKTLPTGLLMRTAFPGISSTFQEGALIDFPTILGMGFTDMPYHIDNIQCEVGKAPAHVRIGWLRSVANIQNVFALASFVDELAVRSKMDPVMFNEQLIGPDRVESKVPDGSEDPNYGESWKKFPLDTSRLKAVLKNTADKFDWNRKLPKGHGKGICVYRSFLTYIAVAAEVSVDSQGNLTLHRFDIGCDCGLIVDPDRVHAQMEGSVVFGISLALMGEMTVKDGAVVQSNFHDAPVVRINEIAPEVNVHLFSNKNIPSGVGEPGVPPVAPAICNAIYDACGVRVRKLPIRKTSLKG